MDDLEKLIAQAKETKLTASEREAQRRSFVYGNTKLENHRITKAIVEDAAEKEQTKRWDLK